jgi:RHS repeat-associated protein
MTTAAICATREPSWNPSSYRGEQYDSDLGLYYLRARYYNPLTGRFLSRDPEAGYINIPKTLHKYLYANGDPVNAKDPTGRGAVFEAALVTAFVIQETAPTILAAAIGICTALEYEDLLEDLWTSGESVWTGESPEGPGGEIGGHDTYSPCVGAIVCAWLDWLVL